MVGPKEKGRAILELVIRNSEIRGIGLRLVIDSR